MYGPIPSQVAESQWAIHGHKLVSLSEQDLGACGGWMTSSGQFTYLYSDGLESYDDYPYDGSSTCKESRSKKVFGGGVFTNNIVMPNAYAEDQLAAFLYRNGPVDMGIDSSILYKQDEDHFITKDKCTSDLRKIDHSQTLVGFGVDPKKGPYWHLKNSWRD
eukprot:gene16299-21403_t